MPISQGMKMSQPQLLVGLDSKMARVGKHWAAVNQELPPNYPLVLLSGFERGGFDELAGRLPGLRDAVRVAELDLKLARAEYERCKREVHQWVRDINMWMRAYYRGTPWFVLVRRVPGLGQSYQHWWDAAHDALGMWRMIVKDPPAPLPGPWEWPLTLGKGKTVEKFEEAVKAFESAWWALLDPEGELKLARGALWQAQGEAAALLMAYGHGVRARLGQKGALVRAIPRLWPKRGSKAGADRALAS